MSKSSKFDFNAINDVIQSEDGETIKSKLNGTEEDWIEFLEKKGAFKDMSPSQKEQAMEMARSVWKLGEESGEDCGDVLGGLATTLSEQTLDSFLKSHSEDPAVLNGALLGMTAIYGDLVGVLGRLVNAHNKLTEEDDPVLYHGSVGGVEVLRMVLEHNIEPKLRKMQALRNEIDSDE